jgi:hypothetical protein
MAAVTTVCSVPANDALQFTLNGTKSPIHLKLCMEAIGSTGGEDPPLAVALL